MSTYISEVTVRLLDAGYVVTWLEDGEPCGSETISEKLARVLVSNDGGVSGINDERSRISMICCLSAESRIDSLICKYRG